MKTTSNGRRLLTKDYLQWKTNSNGRGPPMEDDHLLGPTQILNLSLDYQKLNLQILDMKTTSDGRCPQNIKRGISQQP
jgi:hypothetical protein